METTTNTYQKQPEKKPSTALLVSSYCLALQLLYWDTSTLLNQTTRTDDRRKGHPRRCQKATEKQLRDMIVEYDY
jgi:hypothetical protein